MPRGRHSLFSQRMLRMQAKLLPEADVINELLRYECSTGSLFWRPRDPMWFPHEGRGGRIANAKRWNAQNANLPALSSITASGYLKGRLIDRTVLAHRVIFKMKYGVDPVQIDHIDGDRQNNRLQNLRSVTCIENQRNRGMPKNNTSGVVGVFYDNAVHKWKAFINGGRGPNNYLGAFQTKEAAVLARVSAELEFGYHPNHGRNRTQEVLRAPLSGGGV